MHQAVNLQDVGSSPTAGAKQDQSAWAGFVFYTGLI